MPSPKKTPEWLKGHNRKCEGCGRLFWVIPESGRHAIGVWKCPKCQPTNPTGDNKVFTGGRWVEID